MENKRFFILACLAFGLANQSYGADNQKDSPKYGVAEIMVGMGDAVIEAQALNDLTDPIFEKTSDDRFPAIEHQAYNSMKIAMAEARRTMSEKNEKRFLLKYYEILNRANGISKSIEYKRSLYKNSCNDRARKDALERKKREKLDRMRMVLEEANAALKAADLARKVEIRTGVPLLRSSTISGRKLMFS